MKPFKTILLILICLPLVGAQMPYQSMEVDAQSYLMNLPRDLKVYLIPFIASGDADTIARGIFTAATLNKSFQALINDPKNMTMILDAVPYKSVALRVYRQLKEKEKSLPVMHKQPVRAWIRKTTDSLENGKKLFIAAGGQQERWEPNPNAGDMAELQRLISNKNIDLDWETRGITSLDAAVYNGNIEIARLLLDVGANPNGTADPKIIGGDIKRVPVITAVVAGNEPMVELLLKAKANPNLHKGDRWTALDRAQEGEKRAENATSRTEYSKIIKLLLQYGARSGKPVGVFYGQ